MRCFLLKVQWSLQMTVALFESHTRTSVGKICDRCWSSSSMSDDSSFDEVSVWCFARVEWYWSQSVYGLQAVTVATSNSLFPFPMWCSWAGAYTILVSFEMTHRWNPYQRCGHRLLLSSLKFNRCQATPVTSAVVVGCPRTARRYLAQSAQSFVWTWCR